MQISQHTELNAELPRSGEKSGKLKLIPGLGKVREILFKSGKFRKIKKKSQGISKFSKKVAS